MRSAEAEFTTIALSKSALSDLNLSLLVSREWSIEWYDARSRPSIVRIHRSESQGREAIVVAATKLGERNAGKTADEIFGPDFLESFGKTMNAFVRRRVKTDFWNGAYFEYQIKGAPGGSQVEAHNWLTIADGYLVQFQCYFFHDLSTSPEIRKRQDEKLAQSYREILLSIQK